MSSLNLLSMSKFEKLYNNFRKLILNQKLGFLFCCIEKSNVKDLVEWIIIKSVTKITMKQDAGADVFD